MMLFFDGVKREFAKVFWPTRTELFGATLVVLAFVVAFSIYLGMLDYCLSQVAGKILSL